MGREKTEHVLVILYQYTAMTNKLHNIKLIHKLCNTHKISYVEINVTEIIEEEYILDYANLDYANLDYANLDYVNLDYANLHYAGLWL